MVAISPDLRGRRPSFVGLLILLAACVACVACAPEAPEPVAPPPPAASPEPLRVMVRPDPIAFLPRNADPVVLDREIAAGLAETLGRPLELIHATEYSAMVAALLGGEADLIAANLTATDARRDSIPFSLPYLHTDELLIQARAAEKPASLADVLAPVLVRRSSSYAETLLELAGDYPNVHCHWAEEHLTIEEILDLVASGQAFATAVDQHVWSAVAGHYPNLGVAITLATDRPIALALAPGDDELKRRVDEFLIRRALTERRQEVYTHDLSGLREERRLRMITRNNAATYFLHRGEQLGFEYELMRRFADEQGLRLEIVIPPHRSALLPYLLEGRGDVVSASLTISEERKALASFTDPYLEVAEFVVVRADEADDIHAPEDLAGREVWVRASSPAFAAAERLKQQVPDLRIGLVPEDLETEEVLARVEEGTYDCTIAESHHLEIARHGGRELGVALTLGEAQLGWGVRPDNPHLREELNAFLAREVRGLFYNVIRDRYFGDPDDIERAHDEWRSDVSGRISPWDDLCREYAARYELDWRLVVAQMYEESRFDPTQVSWAGAQGLMQVLPRTAQELGTGDPREPEPSVHAGTKYMRWLIDRFDPRMPLAERIRFALASYNAGRGHVLDAQRLARQLDLDPHVWYGNVEETIQLLERPEYYEVARYGYCRGSEAANYVRKVDRRYRTYAEHVPADPAGAPAGASPVFADRPVGDPALTDRTVAAPTADSTAAGAPTTGPALTTEEGAET